MALDRCDRNWQVALAKDSTARTGLDRITKSGTGAMGLHKRDILSRYVLHAHGGSHARLLRWTVRRSQARAPAILVNEGGSMVAKLIVDYLRIVADHLSNSPTTLAAAEAIRTGVKGVTPPPSADHACGTHTNEGEGCDKGTHTNAQSLFELIEIESPQRRVVDASANNRRRASRVDELDRSCKTQLSGNAQAGSIGCIMA
mmetsp:Transcript_40137/g.105846  ORF Transcript_40137/g.105846 Transcript_40137/m.105846 type:complete len:201 (+) Transcript_40137:1688-2290(+)